MRNFLAALLLVLASGSAALAQVDSRGNVGGYDQSLANTPVVQALAYSSGNAIGGLQTVQFFRTLFPPSGILNNISVASKGGSTTAMTIYVFQASPSASTCTDRAAFVLNAADVSKLVAAVPVVLTPAVVGAGATVTFASSQIPISVRNIDTTPTRNLYVCAVVGGAVTPASVADLVFTFGGVQD